MYLFSLAERLHMTIAMLLDNMSSRELGMWMARDTLIAEEHAKQARLAKMRAKKNRGRG